MTQTYPQKPTQLLDDLESIRALLGDHEPERVSEAVDPDSIPLLSEVVEPAPERASPHEAEPEPREPAVRTAFRTLAERHLDHELRNAAQLILQEVIDDFVPQIEAELRQRLEARAAQLIKSQRP
ncbi:DNA polymerase III subunit chi [Stutzerimonas stutzeri]